MVEYSLQLDAVFGSLADPTRRDILKRVAKRGLSVGEIAARYNLTLAAISKHLGVLEKARLILKRRVGKQHVVELSPPALRVATGYLERYRVLWEDRFDSLEQYLRKEHHGHGK